MNKRKYGVSGFGRIIAIIALVLIVLVFLALAFAKSAGATPNGNGTIKIDRIPWDEIPDNQPHTGCTFQVDFSNFDPLEVANITFALIPPVGDNVILLMDTQHLDANGAGNFTYTLSNYLTGYEPQPNQGYHILVEASTETVGKKSKVFWVQCNPTAVGLSCVLTATPTTGTVPFEVTFDGSQSTGAGVLEYYWDTILPMPDGGHGASSIAMTYILPGESVTTLTVIDMMTMESASCNVTITATGSKESYLPVVVK